jgi:integrase
VPNRTVNIEVSTLRMILKRNKLWHYMVDDVRMLHEREDVGRALDHKEAARLLKACYESNQPSLYPAVVIYCNTGLRSSELRRAHWWQVNFDRGEFQVGKSKTRGGDDRIIPLNQAATDAFAVCRAHWPDAKPNDFIFPSEKLAFDGKGSGKIGVMTSYDVDLSKPIGSGKTAWKTAKKRAGVDCRLHDLRHHFLTNLAETKTSDSTILAIAGHLSRKMLERYSHIRSNAKRTAIEAMVQTSLEHS